MTISKSATLPAPSEAPTFDLDADLAALLNKTASYEACSKRDKVSRELYRVEAKVLYDRIRGQFVARDERLASLVEENRAQSAVIEMCIGDHPAAEYAALVEENQRQAQRIAEIAEAAVALSGHAAVCSVGRFAGCNCGYVDLIRLSRAPIDHGTRTPPSPESTK